MSCCGCETCETEIEAEREVLLARNASPIDLQQFVVIAIFAWRKRWAESLTRGARTCLGLSMRPRSLWWYHKATKVSWFACPPSKQFIP